MCRKKGLCESKMVVKKKIYQHKEVFQQNTLTPIERFKKHVLISLFQKKYLKYDLYLLRKQVIRIFLVSKKKITPLLAKRGMLRLFVNQTKSNTFLNYSNLFTGQIYAAYSCGQYFQGSLRKSKFAVEALLSKSSFNKKKMFFTQRVYVYLTVKGEYFVKGLQKNLKAFLKKPHVFKLKKFIDIQFRAHNGIRQRSQRRK